ncbi:50S ribosomal protein L29 [Candidatus Woesearchaeota archaeon]|nr:50S ribosomal protein L29 [Candidatus Woesearchaeota archaeon]
MAIIRKSELKIMENKSMKEKLLTLRKELMKLKAQVATRTRPENPGRIKEIRRTIARIHTFIRLNQIKKLEEKTKNVKVVKKDKVSKKKPEVKGKKQ